MRADGFFKENSADSNLPTRPRMGRASQPARAAEPLRVAFAGSNVRAEIKRWLTGGLEHSEGKSYPPRFCAGGRRMPKETPALCFPFPKRQSAASLLKAESRFLDIGRIAPVWEPDQAQKTSSALAKPPAGCGWQLLRPGSFVKGQRVARVPRPGSSSAEAQSHPRRRRSVAANAFP